jgi:hypothetical protein
VASPFSLGVEICTGQEDIFGLHTALAFALYDCHVRRASQSGMKSRGRARRQLAQQQTRVFSGRRPIVLSSVVTGQIEISALIRMLTDELLIGKWRVTIKIFKPAT